MNPELEKQACKYFACPNIPSIDDFGMCMKNFNLDTILKARDLSIELYKKTYHLPKFNSYRSATAACIYIASIQVGDKLNQKEIANYFDISCTTLQKYVKMVIKELELINNET